MQRINSFVQLVLISIRITVKNASLKQKININVKNVMEKKNKNHT